MKWIKQIYDCVHAYKLWFLILITTDLLFIFLALIGLPRNL
ncbi:hypothetical protein PD280_10110 [Virgibacillus salarius]|nr:hypothetical protein [Virgibacillus salarius]WBX81965.1 hypothetical protein PD280_10110 [Virgibacillus salarius]